MYKIYLSPSQQSHNLYAWGDTNEQNECNKIAAAAKKYLDKCSEFEAKVAPVGQTMQKTIEESNNWDADIHIPIHTNAVNGKITGTLVMVYDNSNKNVQLGKCIYDAVRDVCKGTTDFGVKVNKNLAELNATKAVAAYVECDFHDNPTMAEFIVKNTEKIGKAIAAGIYKYYGIDFKNETTELPKFYYVQVGAFLNKENAEKLKKELNEYGYNAIIK